MKRTLTLSTAALALLAAVAVGGGTAAQAAVPDTEAPRVFVTDFEDEQARSLWRAGGDATGVKALEIATGDNGCSVDGTSGSYGALRSYIPDTTRKPPVAESNRPIPEATWAGAGFDVSGGQFDVKVTWSARNVKNCENCTAAVFVGGGPARAGGDFDFAGEVGGGWQQFEYETRVDLSGRNRLFVALGWMGSNATIGLDCITVRVARAIQGAAGQPPATHEQAAPNRSAAPPPSEGNYFYDFEGGLKPWRFGTDGTYGSLQRQYGLNGCAVALGGAFASISNIAGPLAPADALDALMIPPPSEPAMYMIAPFMAARAQVSHIELDWMSKSIEGCDGCMQLAYVGDNPHPKVSDFNLLTGGLGADWEATHFETDLKAEPLSTIYVALGWQGPPQTAIDKPELRNAGFDCVSVRIHMPDN